MAVELAEYVGIDEGDNELLEDEDTELEATALKELSDEAELVDVGVFKDVLEPNDDLLAVGVTELMADWEAVYREELVPEEVVVLDCVLEDDCSELDEADFEEEGVPLDEPNPDGVPPADTVSELDSDNRGVAEDELVLDLVLVLKDE